MVRSRAVSFVSVARGLGQCWQPGLRPPGSTSGVWPLYATALRGLSRFGLRMDVHGPFGLAALKPLDDAVPVLLTPACSQDDWQDTALAGSWCRVSLSSALLRCYQQLLIVLTLVSTRCKVLVFPCVPRCRRTRGTGAIRTCRFSWARHDVGCL